MTLDSVTNLVQLLQFRVAATPNATALLVKRDDQFQPVTWQELHDDVLRTAAGLISAGVQFGDRVAQVSENRYEWIVVDFAAMFAGAVHVPIHSTLSASQIAYQISHSESSLVFASDQSQIAKLREVSDQLPTGLPVYSFEHVSGTELHWSKLQTSLTQSDKEEIQSRIDGMASDTLASILYTSGTTGEPRGVMLTHGNLTSNTLDVVAAFPQSQDDIRLNFLPLSHIYARTCDLYTCLASGYTLALAESRETILADCAALQPTLLNGVPYFFERIARIATEKGLTDQPEGLNSLLGGKVKQCCAGGAALPEHVFDFWSDQGLPILHGYGLTETSPVLTLSTKDWHRRGASGRALPHVELKIDEHGEIVTRGPQVMLGYWKDDDATTEIIRDGWLHTGDLGHFDEDGFLTITGRKKELIVTLAGKNIAPIQIETQLAADPLIAQALVIGDGRKYLSALIVPDPDNLKQFIKQQRLWVFSKRGALRHNKVVAKYRDVINQRLANLSKHEQIAKFTIIGRGFTPESGEMTAKLSLRRKLIESNFSDTIQSMYTT